MRCHVWPWLPLTLALAENAELRKQIDVIYHQLQQHIGIVLQLANYNQTVVQQMSCQHTMLRSISAELVQLKQQLVKQQQPTKELVDGHWQYVPCIRALYMFYIQLNVSPRHIETLVRQTLKTFGIDLDAATQSLPKQKAANKMFWELRFMALIEVAEEMFRTSIRDIKHGKGMRNTLHADNTVLDQAKLRSQALALIDDHGDRKQLAFSCNWVRDGCAETSLQYFDHTMEELLGIGNEMELGESQAERDLVFSVLAFSAMNSDRHSAEVKLDRLLAEKALQVAPQLVPDWESMSVQEQTRWTTIYHGSCGMHAIANVCSAYSAAISTMFIWLKGRPPSSYESIPWQELLAEFKASGTKPIKGEGELRKIIRETCKFLSDKAGLKENRWGRYFRMWERLEKADGQYAKMLKRFVGSRNWIDLTNAGPVLAMVLSKHITEFFTDLWDETETPATKYVQETLDMIHQPAAVTGLKALTIFGDELATPARCTIAAASDILQLNPFFEAAHEHLDRGIVDPAAFIDSTAPLAPTSGHQYRCRLKLQQKDGKYVDCCRTCKKPDCDCLEKRQCLCYKKPWTTEFVNSGNDRNVLQALVAHGCECGLVALKRNKEDQLTGGCLHNPDEFMKYCLESCAATNDVSESMFARRDSIAQKPGGKRMSVYAAEGLTLAQQNGTMQKYFDGPADEKKEQKVRIAHRLAARLMKKVGTITEQEDAHYKESLPDREEARKAVRTFKANKRQRIEDATAMTATRYPTSPEKLSGTELKALLLVWKQYVATRNDGKPPRGKFSGTKPVLLARLRELQSEYPNSTEATPTADAVPVAMELEASAEEAPADDDSDSDPDGEYENMPCSGSFGGQIPAIKPAAM